MEVVSVRVLLQVLNRRFLANQSSAVCACITEVKSKVDTFTHCEQPPEILRMTEKVLYF